MGMGWVDNIRYYRVPELAYETNPCSFLTQSLGAIRSVRSGAAFNSGKDTMNNVSGCGSGKPVIPLYVVSPITIPLTILCTSKEVLTLATPEDWIVSKLPSIFLNTTAWGVKLTKTVLSSMMTFLFTLALVEVLVFTKFSMIISLILMSPREQKNKETPLVAENLCSLTRGLIFFTKKTTPK